MRRGVAVNEDSGKAASVAVSQVSVLRVRRTAARGLLHLAAPDQEERNDDEKGYTQQRDHHIHGVGAP